MDENTFAAHIADARSRHPQWFVLDPDRPPDPTTISHHTEALAAILPPEFLTFLRTYGGGDFGGFVHSYSMDPESDLNIVTKNSAPWLSRPDFIAVSDNGAGDYYGFAVVGGVCSSPVVVLDHETGELRPTDHDDWLEFVVERGLSAPG